MTCDFCGEEDYKGYIKVLFFYEDFIDRELGHLDLEKLPEHDKYENCFELGGFKEEWMQLHVNMFFTYDCMNGCLEKLCKTHRIFCDRRYSTNYFIVIVKPGEKRTMYRIVDYEHTF